MNMPKTKTIILDDDGQLYYEPYTHTYVRCRPIDILRAKYELNHKYVEQRGRACLYDFIKWLNIEEKGIGYSLGWDYGDMFMDLKWIDIYEEKLNEDCLMIRYLFEPCTHYPRE